MGTDGPFLNAFLRPASVVNPEMLCVDGDFHVNDLFCFALFLEFTLIQQYSDAAK